MKRVSPSIFARFYQIMFERCHNRRPQVHRERFRTMAGAGRRPDVICSERLRARLYWGGAPGVEYPPIEFAALTGVLGGAS